MEDIQIVNKIIDLEGQGISNEIWLFNTLKNLEEIKTCEDLNLSNNKLSKVVPDMSFLTGLRHLDLENNPIEDFNLLIVNLKSLPSLESLKINLNKNEEFVMFSNSLPSLRILNGKLLKEEFNLGKINIDLDHGDVDPSLFNEEQQRYNHLFTKINEKVKSQGREAVSNFYNEYQKNLQVYFGEDSTKTLKNSASGNLLSFYSNKTTSKQQILMFYMEKLLELNEKKDKDLTILMKEVIQGFNEVNVARVEVIDKLLPKLENCERNMNRKIDDIKRVNNTSIEYDKLMKKYTNIKFILETYIDENKIIKHNYDFLEKENQVLTDKVIKLTKDLAENKGTGTAVVLGQPDKFKAYYNIAKISSPKKNIKILTKKNMHDLIESIYESKTSYDKKCVEIRMPKETMEQHMYTFLNQKFGLKNLIIEWATSIINGIKMYANEEPDICLFGKILRNEIEEDYRVIFKKLKGSIYDLLIVSFF